MTYRLRAFRPDDGDALTRLCLAAIRETGRHAYSAEQVAAWAGRHPGAEMYRWRAAKGATIIVAVDAGDLPVAYALLEPDGHLDRLYNDPAHARQGLATRLLRCCEELARHRRIDRLFTEASELARPVFERAGYAMDHRRDVMIDGMPIHNFAMEKRLA